MDYGMMPLFFSLFFIGTFLLATWRVRMKQKPERMHKERLEKKKKNEEKYDRNLKEEKKDLEKVEKELNLKSLYENKIEKINVKIFHLLKQKKWLNIEERHKLEETFPHDVLELRVLYESLGEKEQEEIKKEVMESLDYVLEWINETKGKISKRKKQKLKTKTNTIKQR